MYKGKLKGFPKEIVKAILKHQVKQGNNEDVSVFEDHISASSLGNGFGWSDTKEGHGFWSTVLIDRNFDRFFEKYPKKTKSKYKGDIKGFPKRIVKEMLKRQVKDGNPKNVKVFENDRHASVDDGGFKWEKTKEGNDFWEDVIINENFNLFFDKISKTKSKFKGYLKNTPKEVVKLLLKRQVEQGNPENISIFEESRRGADDGGGGFTWLDTIEGHAFWRSVLEDRNYTLFFNTYPKKKKGLKKKLQKLKDDSITIICDTKEEAKLLFSLDFPFKINNTELYDNTPWEREYSKQGFTFYDSPRNSFSSFEFFSRNKSEYNPISFKEYFKGYDLYDESEKIIKSYNFEDSVTELITLNRRGFFQTENHTETQCNVEGHEAYNYQAEILCGYKLNDEGFIIDHWLLHDKILAHIKDNPMLSCEVMSKQFAVIIADFMKEHSCDVKEIKTTIIPCNLHDLHEDDKGYLVPDDPNEINYMTPANAIYHVKFD